MAITGALSFQCPSPAPVSTSRSLETAAFADSDSANTYRAACATSQTWTLRPGDPSSSLNGGASSGSARSSTASASRGLPSALASTKHSHSLGAPAHPGDLAAHTHLPLSFLLPPSAVPYLAASPSAAARPRRFFPTGNLDGPNAATRSLAARRCACVAAPSARSGSAGARHGGLGRCSSMVNRSDSHAGPSLTPGLSRHCASDRASGGEPSARSAAAAASGEGVGASSCRYAPYGPLSIVTVRLVAGSVPRRFGNDTSFASGASPSAFARSPRLYSQLG